MLHKLAEDISFYLITNKVIDIEDRDIYIYGLELLISTLFTSISILILGLLIEEWISSSISSSIFFSKILYGWGIMQNIIMNVISIQYLFLLY